MNLSALIFCGKSPMSIHCILLACMSRYEYHWCDGINYKRPTKLPAPQYIGLLMEWVEAQINNEELFPLTVGRYLVMVQHFCMPFGRTRARLYKQTRFVTMSVVGSGGLMVRAPACRSRGRWFDSTSAVSKLGQFHSPHFARVFRKRLKAVGPNSCVSSRLGCLEYNYLRLEYCGPHMCDFVKKILFKSRF